MLPETIYPDWHDEQICRLQDRWKIAGVLATKLVCMANRLPFRIQIISGFRTKEHQERLIREGRGAPVNLSTHTTCPATGADLACGIAVTDVVKATLGEAATACGLRWGGGSTPDPNTGIPWDWQHVDLGPRTSNR